MKEDPLCLDCDPLLEACTSDTAVKRIREHCSNSGHFPQHTLRCAACRADIRAYLDSSADCCHDGKKYMDKCRECFDEIDRAFGSCDHDKTRKMKSMEPSGYHLLVYDNYEKKVALERSYILQEDEDQPVVQNFYETLYHDVIPELEPQLVPHVPMDLTPEEEEQFNRTKHCHLCHKKCFGKFKHRDHW